DLDEHGRLQGQRTGPAGQHTSHGAPAGGSGAAERPGESDGPPGCADGVGFGDLGCADPPVRSISSCVSSIARWSGSHVHWSRYSYPATSDGDRMITDRSASSTPLRASS